MNFNKVKKLTGKHNWNAEHSVGMMLACLVMNEEYKDILETGTCVGRTSAYLASVTPEDGTFKTIDIREWMGDKVRELIDSMPNAEYLIGSSHDYLRNMKEDSVDFIYLDANHEKWFVRKEFDLAERVLRVGGMICLHDTVGIQALVDLAKDLNKLPRFDVVTINTPANNGLTIVKYKHKKKDEKSRLFWNWGNESGDDFPR
jgi:predicted O-methyltransferase YrrM